MKAEELMIGDWIFYGGEAVKVLQLSKGRKYDQCKPIPLTREILEKNGFTYSKAILGYDIPCFETPWSANGFYIEEWEKGKFILTDHTKMCFSYVHEFQHLLKLCGIEKEIIL